MKRIAVLLVAAVCACSRTNAAPAEQAGGVRAEAVTFRNGDVSLAGTLFLPAGAGRHPAVVLFHGSGGEARNPMMGRWFAEHGVAALTYDKRGVGQSTGDFRQIPFVDLVADGLAGLALLKTRADIDAAQIGVWGLSQGGWLGPLAASLSRDVAFVIAVSGPGVSPGEQMVFYYGEQMRQKGFRDEEVREASDARRKFWHAMSTAEGKDEARAALEQARTRPWSSLFNEQMHGVLNRPADEVLNDDALRAGQWFRIEVNYDPTAALRALKVPALFIFGDRDDITPVERSVAVIRETLDKTAHQDFSIVVVPGGNHGLMSFSSSGPAFMPEYLGAIDTWLRRIIKK